MNVFYTAPTAIRSLIKAGGDLPKKYDLKSLRILGTVGEPINPEAWMWWSWMIIQKRPESGYVGTPSNITSVVPTASGP